MAERRIDGLKIEVPGKVLFERAQKAIGKMEAAISEMRTVEKQAREFNASPSVTQSNRVELRTHEIERLEGRLDYVRFVAEHLARDAVYILDAREFTNVFDGDGLRAGY